MLLLVIGLVILYAMASRLHREYTLHVDEWLDRPARDHGEAKAKIWLNKFRAPAHKKDWDYLDNHTVYCNWKGETWVCCGASRMGDVWLRRAGSRPSSGYEHRVRVSSLSKWNCVRKPAHTGRNKS